MAISRRVVVFLSIAVGALACYGDKSGPPAPSRVDFNVYAVTVVPETASVRPGGRLQLAASVNAGAGVTERAVVWTSSNPLIATVAADGWVTTLNGTGMVVITATSKADPAFTGISRITVTTAPSADRR